MFVTSNGDKVWKNHSNPSSVAIITNIFLFDSIHRNTGDSFLNFPRPNLGITLTKGNHSINKNCNMLIFTDRDNGFIYSKV